MILEPGPAGLFHVVEGHATTPSPLPTPPLHCTVPCLVIACYSFMCYTMLLPFLCALMRTPVLVIWVTPYRVPTWLNTRTCTERICVPLLYAPGRAPVRQTDRRTVFELGKSSNTSSLCTQVQHLTMCLCSRDRFLWLPGM